MRFEEIVEGDERSVLEALANPKWDFRTLDGISKETGLTTEKVEKAIDKYSEYVRKSPVPDRKGRALFTLRSRPITSQERFAMVRAFVSKSLR